jgi:diadenosine tetraphosphate (Ap4A) HIT family hydrolase
MNTKIKDQRELIIDQEFKDLIPPLTENEYAELKESIRTHGFRPERGLVMTWNDIIIDGHNRYQACQELFAENGKVFFDIDKHTREMDNLKTRQDVVLWMLRNQLGRRNLADAAKINIIFKTEILLNELAKANLATSTGGHTPQPLPNSAKAGQPGINTRKTMAKIAGKSEDTIWKVGQIIAKADPDLIDEVMSGRKSIHAGFMAMKAIEETKEKAKNSIIDKAPNPPKKEPKNDCSMCDSLSKYISGELMCEKVYESKHALAIFATKPYAEVHILIMTKNHIATVFDIENPDIILDINKAVKTASKKVIAMKGACKLEMYLGEFQNAKHFHCHVIYDASIN